MFIETVTGTNGILPPPKGYLQGLRALLDKYDILMVCDEVMAGWGRTGKLFAFEHGDIVPDMVCMAKGLTSSYVPLGAVAKSLSAVCKHLTPSGSFGPREWLKLCRNACPDPCDFQAGPHCCLTLDLLLLMLCRSSWS